MPARKNPNTSGMTTRNQSRAQSQDQLNLAGIEAQNNTVNVSSCPATPTRGLGGFATEDASTIRASGSYHQGRRVLMASNSDELPGPSNCIMSHINQAPSVGPLQANNTFHPIVPVASGSLESVYQNLEANSMNSYLDSRGLLNRDENRGGQSISLRAPVPMNNPGVLQPTVSIAPNAPLAGNNLIEGNNVGPAASISNFVQPNPSLAPSNARSGVNSGEVLSGAYAPQGNAGEETVQRSRPHTVDRRGTANSSHSINSPYPSYKPDISTRFLQAMVLELQKSMDSQRQAYEEHVARLRDDMRDMSQQNMEIIGKLIQNQTSVNSTVGQGRGEHIAAPSTQVRGPLLQSIQREAELQELRFNTRRKHHFESTPLCENNRQFPAGIIVGKLYTMDEYQMLVNNFGYPFEGLEAIFDTQHNGIIFMERSGDADNSGLGRSQGASSILKPGPVVFSSGTNQIGESNTRFQMNYVSAHAPNLPTVTSAFASVPAEKCAQLSRAVPMESVPYSTGLGQQRGHDINPSVSGQMPVVTHNSTYQGQPALQLRPADIPRYTGLPSERTPYDFLIELEKFKSISRSSDCHMLEKVVPLALSDRAYTWYRFEQEIRAFADWEDFKRRFRREFQTTYYDQKLRRMMEDRFQGPDESLVSYIRTVLSYYERLETDKPQESEKIDFIKRHLHPDYRSVLQGQRFTTIAELIEAAFEAQEAINLQELYKVPTSAPSIEPSLQYQPKESLVKPSAISMKSAETYATISGGSVQKHVNFRPEQVFRQSSQNERRFRTASPAPVSRPESAASNRSQSPGDQRRCYLCNSLDHMRRDCPQNNQQNRSENSRTPSPSRQGLGERNMKVHHTNLSKPNQN
jgi:hypothetical protein